MCIHYAQTHRVGFWGAYETFIWINWATFWFCWIKLSLLLVIPNGSFTLVWYFLFFSIILLLCFYKISGCLSKNLGHVLKRRKKFTYPAYISGKIKKKMDRVNSTIMWFLLQYLINFFVEKSSLFHRGILSFFSLIYQDITSKGVKSTIKVVIT